MFSTTYPKDSFEVGNYLWSWRLLLWCILMCIDLFIPYGLFWYLLVRSREGFDAGDDSSLASIWYVTVWSFLLNTLLYESSTILLYRESSSYTILIELFVADVSLASKLHVINRKRHFKSVGREISINTSG